MPKYVHTTKELEQIVIEKTGAKDFFDLLKICPKCITTWWPDLKILEFKRALEDKEFYKQGVKDPCDTKVLTHAEYQKWLAKFDKIRNK